MPTCVRVSTSHSEPPLRGREGLEAPPNERALTARLRGPIAPKGPGTGGLRVAGTEGGPPLNGRPRPRPGTGAPRPAHRHGRRAQWEALVVVVPGPVERVLELGPRTPLGLADALLALVVHPEQVTVWFRHDLDAARFLPPNAPSLAGAAPKRPSLRQGAFKVAFQKIHAPATSGASGWASSGRPPRPTASCGPPLASAICEIRLHARRLGAMLRRSPCWRPAPPGCGLRTTSGCASLPSGRFRPGSQQLLLLQLLSVWRASSRLVSSRGHVAQPHRPGVAARVSPPTAP